MGVITRICLLAALMPPAMAQMPPSGRPFVNHFDVMAFDVARGMRLDLGFAAYSPSALSSQYSVLTPLYWSREYDEGIRLQSPFGTPLGQGTAIGPYAIEQVAIPGHPQFKLFEELRWPFAASLTGLQFQRQSLLVQGDRLSIRATGRHAMLLWQLGEATHEIEWRVSAHMQHHAYGESASTSTIAVEAVRRF